MKMKNLFMAVFAVMIVSSLFSFMIDTDSLIGTWNFTASGAPEGYNQGKIEFADKEGNLRGQIITERETFDMENLKVANDSITYDINVQSTTLQGVLVKVQDSISGKIITSGGDLVITGKKQAKTN